MESSTKDTKGHEGKPVPPGMAEVTVVLPRNIGCA
jgi:hypothetical protein